MDNSKISEERDKLREELSIKKKPELDYLVKFQPKYVAKTQIKRFSINRECSQENVIFEEWPKCFPNWLHRFTFLPAVYEGSNFFTSLTHLLLFFLFWLLVGMKWYFIMVLMYILLIMLSIFSCVFCHLFIFFVEMSTQLALKIKSEY